MVIQYIELGEQFTDRQIERIRERDRDRQKRQSETGQFIAIESRRGPLVCVCVRLHMSSLNLNSKRIGKRSGNRKTYRYHDGAAVFLHDQDFCYVCLCCLQPRIGDI